HQPDGRAARLDQRRGQEAGSGFHRRAADSEEEGRTLGAMGAELERASIKGTVAFTGRLASMKRAEAFEHVRKHGGTPRRGVTKGTSLLVVGELGWPLLGDGRPSNSLARAKSFGVAIASERRVLEWVRRAPVEGPHRPEGPVRLAGRRAAGESRRAVR